MNPNQFLQCPKCHGSMRTFNRNGIHIEQCDSCRGVFLDYGEMEALIRMESQLGHAAPPPAPGYPAPAWGAPHHGHRHKHHSFTKMLFSS